MMIKDKFSENLCYYDETSFETASYPGVIYYRNEYGKTRRAELSIGTEELPFNKYKVLTN